VGDNEESVAAVIGSLEALAMRCSDTMKELKYFCNCLKGLVFSLPYIYIYIYMVVKNEF